MGHPEFHQQKVRVHIVMEQKSVFQHRLSRGMHLQHGITTVSLQQTHISCMQIHQPHIQHMLKYRI